MKNVTYLLSLTLILFLSCSDDGDQGNSNSNTLVGTWQVIEIIGQHPTFGTETATNVQGTIRFNANNTGKENYSFRAFDVPIFENDEFTWQSSPTQIITDPGLGSELLWTRLENTPNRQRARYGDPDGFTYTFTITK